jgi:hypothetical protein
MTGACSHCRQKDSRPSSEREESHRVGNRGRLAFKVPWRFCNMEPAVLRFLPIGRLTPLSSGWCSTSRLPRGSLCPSHRTSSIVRWTFFPASHSLPRNPVLIPRVPFPPPAPPQSMLCPPCPDSMVQSIFLPLMTSTRPTTPVQQKNVNEDNENRLNKCIE